VGRSQRLSDLIQGIGADVKALFTRVLPTGGSAGQVLSKTGSGNYAVGWTNAAADRETLRWTGSAYPPKTKPFADYQGPVEPSLIDGDTWFDTTLSLVVLGADVVNANATANTLQDVTGLAFDVKAGVRYHFKFVIPYTAQATGTGSRWTISGPAFSSLYYVSDYSLTTTSRTMNEGLSTYNSPSAANATSATTGSNMAIIEGIIQPSADGVVIARFASEVANSAITAKAGAFVRVTRL
jgi:hypothetical protein